MTDFASDVGSILSPEVEQDLRTFADLVLKWNQKINLISRSTAAEIWERHVLDSVQLWPLSSADSRVWVDIGSGGGFPGMVIAIIAKALRPQMRVVLVESDKRKAAFLIQAARSVGVACDVRAERIEEVGDLGADVVSARALASLSELLGLGAKLGRPEAVMIFPKGERAQDEIEHAMQEWHFQIAQVQSITNPAASLVRITNLRHV